VPGVLEPRPVKEKDMPVAHGSNGSGFINRGGGAS
jgi:hypothetical protein